ncbi:FtsX-like permease family protein [Actinomyces timonensis]|uniref:FtsX-like permease family protein n=1 Tax=Actinomyces timonensis TaxID=1288391 RepID=A0AAU8N583_9ACTO
MSDHASQFFGATGSQVRRIALMTCASSLALSFLITALLVTLILTREREQVTTLRALGAPVRSIRRHYLTRFGIIAVIGLVTGILLALSVGDLAVSTIMASRGAPGIELLPQARVVALMIPAAVIVTTAVAIGLALRRLPTASPRTSE